MGYADHEMPTNHDHNAASMPTPSDASMVRIARQRRQWRIDTPQAAGTDESPLRRVWDDVQRAFDRIITPFGEEGGTVGVPWPAVDMFERAGQLVIAVDVPGMRLDDVRLQMDGGMLRIAGERRAPAQGTDPGCHHVERRYGHFIRTVPLPAWVDTDRVHARLDAGVLEVCTPIPPTASGRTIPIRDGSRES